MIKSFRALLKRGYYGVHYHMSEKHLRPYVTEIAHRPNAARHDIVDCIAGTIDGMFGRRFPNKKLIA